LGLAVTLPSAQRHNQISKIGDIFEEISTVFMGITPSISLCAVYFTISTIVLYFGPSVLLIPWLLDSLPLTQTKQVGSQCRPLFNRKLPKRILQGIS
jgi:hypothetical protein